MAESLLLEAQQLGKMVVAEGLGSRRHQLVGDLKELLVELNPLVEEQIPSVDLLMDK